MTTLTTEQRQSIVSCLSDLFKDVHGSRPRYNYSTWSDAEIKEHYDSLCEMLDHKEQVEQKIEAENYVAYQKHLADVQSLCNCSKKRALEIIFESHDLPNSNDYDFLCFLLGISYSVANEMKTY